MIRDLDALDHSPPPRYDVCIVGTGPAGLVVADELAGRGLALCLLESGARRPTPGADALRRVVSEGIAVKEYSRERVLGGASTTWAGLSSPLDPVDFEPRPGERHGGWPLARDELIPFWSEASRRYRFAPLEMFAPGALAARVAPESGRLPWRDVEEKTFLAAGEAQDFGRDLDALVEGPEVDVVLGATAVEIVGPGAHHDDGSSSRAPPRTGAADGVPPGDASAGAAGATTGDAAIVVRGVRVRTRGGREHLVAARHVVVATGGLENARLLLQSRDTCPAGLGNARDQVGRHLMNHPKNYHGILRLSRPVTGMPLYFGSLHQGFAGYAGLRLREDIQRERGLLNGYVRFEPLFPWSDSRGVEALVLAVKRSRLLFRLWKERRREEVVTLRDYSETGDDSELQNRRRGLLGWLALIPVVVADGPAVARYLLARLRRGAPPVTRVRLRNFMEMEPRHENRVVLGDELDPLGCPVPIVRHDTSALDRRSLVALHETLAGEVRRVGLGELETSLGAADPWPIDQDASHHLGTTRMGTDPATSVVDVHQRVHGTANVWMAGGSVFPTSGCANPTYTIAALSIRLGRHLAGVLSAGGRRSRTGTPGDADAAPATSATAADAGPPPPDRGTAGDAGSRRDAGPLADGAPRPAVAARPVSLGGRPGRRRVLVVGAGGRVTADVLPVLASLDEHVELAAVVARSARSIDSPWGGIRTTTWDELGDGTAGADLVHVAVTKGAVPAVLDRLERRGGRGLELVLDTPVLLFKHLGHLRRLSAFAAVSVAEDAVAMPWLDVVRRAEDEGVLGPLRHVHCERSAWRYHALATLKTLHRSRRIGSARRRRRGEGARLDLRFAGGGTATVVEPRDYARGHVLLEGALASASDAPERPRGVLPLHAVVADGRCRGFRLGDLETGLTEDESALAGAVAAGATITAHTDDWKRVGLRRLWLDVLDGRGGWPLAEGLDDMAIDFLLEKTGVWIHNPLLSTKASVGRSLLSASLRLLGRG